MVFEWAFFFSTSAHHEVGPSCQLSRIGSNPISQSPRGAQQFCMKLYVVLRARKARNLDFGALGALRVTCFQITLPTVFDDFYRKKCSDRIFFHGKSSLVIVLTIGMHLGCWEHPQKRREPEPSKNHDFLAKLIIFGN